ncbi:hypothetical protein G7K_1427-t1 [Saitoella complicata NRRL Y-17804]|uniref:Stress response RCI peptide n=2 Tax=Saitoella complicata (strain BCRC 22490 / CBS 7301 / JCM 7358 / NBRC 10748 / NRRL Y-17804) TaxID=698492 RepID=A0A0E9NBG3_SAICN|nr:hypothetical protein G7K_1427-t1 [Saitoella complicata NRRL Y-17804]
MGFTCPDLFLCLLAVLIPPIPVGIKAGFCTADLLINICLCVLGVIPGLVHAWYIIGKYPEHDRRRAARGSQQRSRSVREDLERAQRTRLGPGYQRVPQKEQRNYGAVPRGEEGVGEGSSAGGVGGQGEVPPSYASVVKGDNKVQTDD